MLATLRRLILPPIEVEHAGNATQIVRAGLIVVAVLVFGVGGFLVFAPLSGAVVAPAFVKVDLNRKPVQHQEGGIVSEVLVRDGDRVEAGQTLLVLKDVRVDATNDLLGTQLDAELGRTARLNAERQLDTLVTFPRELTSRSTDPRVAEYLKRERVLFSTRRNTLEGQIRLLQHQIAETEREVTAWSQQLKAGDNAIRLQKEELAANESLVGQGFVTKARVLGLQRVLSEYEARRGENLAELSKTRQRLTELELRIITLRNNYMQQAADEHKEAASRVYDLEERLRPSQDAAQRQEVRAPIAGEVVNLRVAGPGAIVGPRDALLDLVPENPDLIVEARIRPEDIASVHKGSEADVRLTAFKMRTTPVVTGSVIYVSADRLQERPEGPAYYVAHVKVGVQALKLAGDLTLQAGMPAEVFVRTGARTPLQYLLDPLTGYLQRSMREP